MEEQLLKHLRQDARKSLAKISRQTQIPVSTLFKKQRKCEKNLIRKYTCLLNFNRLGFGSRIQVALKVKKEKKQELQNYLIQNMFVNSLSKTSNGYDFFLEAIFRNEMESQDFIDLLKERFQIEDIKVYHVISDLQREMFLVKTGKSL